MCKRKNKRKTRRKTKPGWKKKGKIKTRKGKMHQNRKSKLTKNEDHNRKKKLNTTTGHIMLLNFVLTAMGYTPCSPSICRYGPFALLTRSGVDSAG